MQSIVLWMCMKIHTYEVLIMWMLMRLNLNKRHWVLNVGWITGSFLLYSLEEVICQNSPPHMVIDFTADPRTQFIVLLCLFLEIGRSDFITHYTKPSLLCSCLTSSYHLTFLCLYPMLQACTTTCHSPTLWSLLHSFFTLCLSHFLESSYIYLIHFFIFISLICVVCNSFIKDELNVTLSMMSSLSPHKVWDASKKEASQNFEWYICLSSPEADRVESRMLTTEGKKR